MGRFRGFAACFAFVLIAAGGFGLQAQEVRLDATRDVWISDVGREADGNNGAAPRLKVKSIQEMSLLDFDVAPLRGRTVTKAALHVKLAGDQHLRRVTVSSIGAEWFEGTGTNYAITPGGATFRHRRHPDLSWSIVPSGGDICYVILSNGGTSWGMSNASAPTADGWQSIPVATRVVAARVAGVSSGFLVFDDTGTEWTRKGEQFTLHTFPNRFFYSREQNKASAPYLTVTLGPEDAQPPAAPQDLKSEARDLPPGEAIITWVTPGDQGPAGTLGYMATIDGRPVPRELIPIARRPGSIAEMHLRDLGLEKSASVRLELRAVDRAGNVGPPASVAVQPSQPQPASFPGTLTEKGSKEASNPSAPANRPNAGSPGRSPQGTSRPSKPEIAVIDELDKVDPVSDALIPGHPQDEDYLRHNHLWDAATQTITLHAARNESIAFQVLVRGRNVRQNTAIQPSMSFDAPAGAGIRFAFGRYHLVPAGDAGLADPIVPLGVAAPLVVRERPDHPFSRSLHVELHVPHQMTAGTHRGSLSLKIGDETFRVGVSLTVWDFMLPDHLSFLPEMNTYGLPENERDYYRLAHLHRTVLNRLGYNQRGEVHDGCAPAWNGSKLNFSAWDRRFGPLLDGSAFADLPRKGVPIECFYLPLHENWPTPLEGNYNRSYWADEAFSSGYRQAFVSASRQFAEHFLAKGWSDTLFHGFLNNKNNFKERGWSRGSSPWLLDEPANFQDFWALRYFALAFHEGVNQARPRGGSGATTSSAFPSLLFRADISRPQWRRDVLDGLLDYYVVGSAMRQYHQLVFDKKRRFGEIVLEYGGTNPVSGSNYQPVGWSLDAWSLGADGVLPWETVGTMESWRKADELSLFYPMHAPGAARGRGPGVVPSVRLKAYRRGQQDVEYLTLWAQVRGLPRWAVGRELRQVLNLSGSRSGTETGGAEDAGRIDYSGLKAGELENLRVQIGRALSEAHPTPRNRLVDFRTPPRSP
jgi:hypothetical protein